MGARHMCRTQSVVHRGIRAISTTSTGYKAPDRFVGAHLPSDFVESADFLYLGGCTVHVEKRLFFIYLILQLLESLFLCACCMFLCLCVFIFSADPSA